VTAHEHERALNPEPRYYGGDRSITDDVPDEVRNRESHARSQFSKTPYVGLDVHKESIAVADPEEAGGPGEDGSA